MFRKIFLIGSALVFAFAVLITSVIQTSAESCLIGVYAENGTESAVMEIGEETKSVEYFLPYPGILPGHLLYPVKELRDRFLVFFTTNPLKRAELFLLFTDKRIGAAQRLIESGKQELGVVTLRKAEEYLGKAIDQEKVARDKGQDTIEFLEKLAKATLKHEEIILALEEKVDDSAKNTVADILSYPRQGYEKVIGILGKQN